MLAPSTFGACAEIPTEEMERTPILLRMRTCEADERQRKNTTSAIAIRTSDMTTTTIVASMARTP